MRSKFFVSALMVSTIAAAFGIQAVHAQSTPSKFEAPSSKPGATSVVLVHGAFADGSSWNKLIPTLQQRGLNVVSVQNPLTSLADDVASVKRVLDAQTGPVVLVGHSWGGTVITEAGNHPKVAALVYVAAFAPADGQATSQLGKEYPVPPGITKLVPYSDGFVRLPYEAVQHDFAQDLPRVEVNLIAVTQGPIRAANFDEKVSRAAWKAKPSWYVVATKDRMIDPRTQQALAKQIQATTVELPTSHVPMVSRPHEVAKVILDAAKRVTTTGAR